MQRFLLILTIFTFGALAAFSRLGPEPDTAPAKAESPIRYEHVVRSDPPMHIHVATIDLTDPRVRLRVCPGGDDPDGSGPWQTTLRNVHEIAQRNGLEVAVNGNFFSCKEARTFAGRSIPYFTGNWAMVDGRAMTDGRIWSDRDAGVSQLVVDRKGRVLIGRFWPDLPEGAWQVVSGSEVVVKHGKIVATATDTAPRTCVGVDRAGTRLVMIVVDGRRTEYSAGMTGRQLAQEMINLGCDDAINLDGGGSSTMAIRDRIENVVRVVNRPSDGHDLPISMSLERPVACAFGVQIVQDGERAYPDAR